MKLFVGNIPYSMSEEELKEVFTECGSLKSCRLVIDRDTGRSKGFGFVEYETEEEAKSAIDEINGREVQGKVLVVNEARPQEKRSHSRPPTRRR